MNILKTIIANTPKENKSKAIKGNFIFYNLSLYNDHKENSEKLIKQFIKSINDKSNALTKYLKRHILTPIGKD